MLMPSREWSRMVRSKASFSRSACSIRFRSVMSGLLPTMPRNSPEEEKRGTPRESTQRQSPDALLTRASQANGRRSRVAARNSPT